MALSDLWASDRAQVMQKRIEQLIAFAGEGKLLDGNATSVELRELLGVVPSDLLGKWISECLTNRFSDFGFVLQDIVNEIGQRLGFNVSFGAYRGRQGGEGYDGLWRVPSGGAILVESKSSTSYSIDLARIAHYRKQASSGLDIAPEDVSILLVVGQHETESLEAQVRGSRYAWSVRLLGTDSLFRLLQLKETLDDPAVERQIQEILVPQEFTRLDRIVDLVFATAEDVQSDVEETDLSEEEEPIVRKPRAAFHAAVIPRLEKHFGSALVKRSRVLWATSANDIVVSCQVSREFSERHDMHYWFGLKRTTKEALEAHKDSYCAFALGSPERVILMPYQHLAAHLDGLWTSPEEDGRVRHWHLRFAGTGEKVELLVERDQNRLDVSSHLLH